ncbi:MAG TPA: sigma-70 family RNA polymerase sigma factor [Sphingobacteriaceae bacterium]
MDDIYVGKVLKGDPTAFGYFLTQYKNMAYTIAISILKDEFVAEEVVQDAFMKAFRNLDNFQRQSKFSTWFYRIVTNESLMRLKILKKDILDFNPVYEEDIWDEGIDIDIMAEDRHYLVNEALNQLPPKESLVLRLFYLEEERIKAICEITGWSEANVKVLLHRARKNMFIALHQLMKLKT